MGRKVPLWMKKTADLSNPARLRLMTADERLAEFIEVRELLRTILGERSDRAAVLSSVDAPSPRRPNAGGATWWRSCTAPRTRPTPSLPPRPTGRCLRQFAHRREREFHHGQSGRCSSLKS